MSGLELQQSLQALNYPNPHNLDAESHEWMFDHEAIVPFLEWFCNEVQPSNLLDPRDFKE